MVNRTRLPPGAVVALATVVALSGAVFLFSGAWAVPRIGAGLLVASYGLLGIGLGSAVFLALLFVTGARWSDPIRPVAEMLTRLLPAGAAGMAVVLIAFPSLYPWIDTPHDSGSPFQALWLYRPFFLLRAAIYLGLWLGLAALLVHASRQVDAGADRAKAVRAAVRISAVFLVVFALTCWLASVDWIMSLEPRWSSTVFGIYQFAGMFLGALAAVIVLVAWRNWQGSFAGGLTRGRRRDLGTLLFAFSSFWMYIWFCQYLLIWYVNIPEETEYYVLRQPFPGNVLVIANLLLGWGVPFLVLLYRPAKESPAALLIVALIVLAGRWLDLYLMVVPPTLGAGAAITIADAGLLLGTVALAALLLTYRKTARKTAPPVGEML